MRKRWRRVFISLCVFIGLLYPGNMVYLIAEDGESEQPGSGNETLYSDSDEIEVVDVLDGRGSLADCKEISSIEAMDISSDEWTKDNIAEDVTTEEDSIDITKQRQIKVALIDTGVDTTDVTLVGHIAEGYDTSNMSDENGHGTLMAEIIASNTNENVKIVPYRVFDESGKATVGATYHALLKAMNDEVDVISLSVSGYGTSNMLSSVIAKAKEAGIYVVVAAGNDGDNADAFMPGNISEALTVSGVSVDETGARTLAAYSNHGSVVDYSALGTIVKDKGTEDTSDDEVYEGTSISAANVTAYIATMLQYIKNDKTTLNDEVLDALNSTIEDLGEVGRDNSFGMGYLSFEGIQKYIADKTRLVSESEESEPNEEEMTGHDSITPTEELSEEEYPNEEGDIDLVFDEEDAGQKLEYGTTNCVDYFGLKVFNDIKSASDFRACINWANGDTGHTYVLQIRKDINFVNDGYYTISRPMYIQGPETGSFTITNIHLVVASSGVVIQRNLKIKGRAEGCSEDVPVIKVNAGASLGVDTNVKIVDGTNGISNYGTCTLSGNVHIYDNLGDGVFNAGSLICNGSNISENGTRPYSDKDAHIRLPNGIKSGQEYSFSGISNHGSCVIDSSTFHSNAHNGIMNKGSLSITSSKVYSNGVNGISSNTGGNSYEITISSNNVFSNKNNGIVATNGGVISINSCNVYSNGGEGIQNGSDNSATLGMTLDGNNVYNNGTNGVFNNVGNSMIIYSGSYHNNGSRQLYNLSKPSSHVNYGFGVIINGGSFYSDDTGRDAIKNGNLDISKNINIQGAICVQGNTSISAPEGKSATYNDNGSFVIQGDVSIGGGGTGFNNHGEGYVGHETVSTVSISTGKSAISNYGTLKINNWNGYENENIFSSQNDNAIYNTGAIHMVNCCTIHSASANGIYNKGGTMNLASSSYVYGRDNGILNYGTINSLSFANAFYWNVTNALYGVVGSNRGILNGSDEYVGYINCEINCNVLGDAYQGIKNGRNGIMVGTGVYANVYSRGSYAVENANLHTGVTGIDHIYGGICGNDGIVNNGYRINTISATIASTNGNAVKNIAGGTIGSISGKITATNYYALINYGIVSAVNATMSNNGSPAYACVYNGKGAVLSNLFATITAVYNGINNDGTITQTDGTISGGIWGLSNSGSYTQTGGVIKGSSENSSGSNGGVYQNGTYSISGSAQVSSGDVFLCKGRMIHVSNPLSGTQKVASIDSEDKNVGKVLVRVSYQSGNSAQNTCEDYRKSGRFSLSKNLSNVKTSSADISEVSATYNGAGDEHKAVLRAGQGEQQNNVESQNPELMNKSFTNGDEGTLVLSCYLDVTYDLSNIEKLTGLCAHTLQSDGVVIEEYNQNIWKEAFVPTESEYSIYANNNDNTVVLSSLNGNISKTTDYEKSNVLSEVFDAVVSGKGGMDLLVAGKTYYGNGNSLGDGVDSYTFLGWCLQEDGSGYIYESPTSFPIGNNYTWYPIFDVDYSVEYNSNYASPDRRTLGGVMRYDIYNNGSSAEKTTETIETKNMKAVSEDSFFIESVKNDSNHLYSTGIVMDNCGPNGDTPNYWNKEIESYHKDTYSGGEEPYTYWYQFIGWSLDKTSNFTDINNTNSAEKVYTAGSNSFVSSKAAYVNSNRIVNNTDRLERWSFMSDNRELVKVADYNGKSLVYITMYAIWDEYPEIFVNDITLMSNDASLTNSDTFKQMIVDNYVTKMDFEQSYKSDESLTVTVDNIDFDTLKSIGHGGADIGTVSVTVKVVDEVGNESFDIGDVTIISGLGITSQYDGEKAPLYVRFVDEKNWLKNDFWSVIFDGGNKSLNDVVGKDKNGRKSNMAAICKAYEIWLTETGLSDDVRSILDGVVDIDTIESLSDISTSQTNLQSTVNNTLNGAMEPYSKWYLNPDLVLYIYEVFEMQ